jgi:hypothetical protein
MVRRTRFLLAALALSLVACTGQLGRPPGVVAPADGGGVVIDVDLGSRVDLGGPPPPVDLGPPPPVDLGPAPPVDLGPMPGCASGPLALPIAGCAPTPVPNTGDPHADCVTRINQFRWQCQCLPPLTRWVAGEACADQQAAYDAAATTPHAGFSAGICASGYGQNECPGWFGWGSVESTIADCLQSMWDEGPGDFYGPPAHGHYINMSSSSFSMVACGFYTNGGATTAVQNFQ